MPSRHQLVLSQQQGDPFLGFLGTALGALGRVAVRGISSLFSKKASTALVGAGGSKLAQISGIAGQVGLATAAGSLLRAGQGSQGGVFQAGRVSRAIQRILPGGKTGFELVPRRRMNPANIKALRRATRRVAGFHKLATKAERELRKFAPRTRRSSSHEHARPVAAVSVR